MCKFIMKQTSRTYNNLYLWFSFKYPIARKFYEIDTQQIYRANSLIMIFNFDISTVKIPFLKKIYIKR
jgi:hypothetical protein